MSIVEYPKMSIKWFTKIFLSSVTCNKCTNIITNDQREHTLWGQKGYQGQPYQTF